MQPIQGQVLQKDTSIITTAMNNRQSMVNNLIGLAPSLINTAMEIDERVRKQNDILNQKRFAANQERLALIQQTNPYGFNDDKEYIALNTENNRYKLYGQFGNQVDIFKGIDMGLRDMMQGRVFGESAAAVAGLPAGDKFLDSNKVIPTDQYIDQLNYSKLPAAYKNDAESAAYNAVMNNADSTQEQKKAAWAKFSSHAKEMVDKYKEQDPGFMASMVTKDKALQLYGDMLDPAEAMTVQQNFEHNSRPDVVIANLINTGSARFTTDQQEFTDNLGAGVKAKYEEYKAAGYDENDETMKLMKDAIDKYDKGDYDSFLSGVQGLNNKEVVKETVIAADVNQDNSQANSQVPQKQTASATLPDSNVVGIQFKPAVVGKNDTVDFSGVQMGKVGNKDVAIKPVGNKTVKDQTIYSNQTAMASVLSKALPNFKEETLRSMLGVKESANDNQKKLLIGQLKNAGWKGTDQELLSNWWRYRDGAALTIESTLDKYKDKGLTIEDIANQTKYKNAGNAMPDYAGNGPMAKKIGNLAPTVNNNILLLPSRAGAAPQKQETPEPQKIKEKSKVFFDLSGKPVSGTVLSADPEKINRANAILADSSKYPISEIVEASRILSGVKSTEVPKLRIDPNVTVEVPGIGSMKAGTYLRRINQDNRSLQRYYELSNGFNINPFDALNDATVQGDPKLMTKYTIAAKALTDATGLAKQDMDMMKTIIDSQLAKDKFEWQKKDDETKNNIEYMKAAAMGKASQGNKQVIDDSLATYQKLNGIGNGLSQALGDAKLKLEKIRAENSAWGADGTKSQAYLDYAKEVQALEKAVNENRTFTTAAAVQYSFASGTPLPTGGDTVKTNNGQAPAKDAGNTSNANSILDKYNR